MAETPDSVPSIDNQRSSDHLQSSNNGIETKPGYRGDGVLSLYLSTMLSHPAVQKAALEDQQFFQAQLQQFLLAHVQQARDNMRFSRQKVQQSTKHDHPAMDIQIFQNPGRSFYGWVTTTGARSVSALMSFAFLTCLLGAYTRKGSRTAKCFDTAYLQYLAEDLSAHIANMSRLYNDWGSLDRDLRECNVNSINFPEFADTSSNGQHLEVGEKRKEERSNDYEQDRKRRSKAELLTLAEHERRQMEGVMEALTQALEDKVSTRYRKIASGLRLLTDVAKLYGDMYLIKDLSNAAATNGTNGTNGSNGTKKTKMGVE